MSNLIHHANVTVRRVPAADRVRRLHEHEERARDDGRHSASARYEDTVELSDEAQDAYERHAESQNAEAEEHFELDGWAEDRRQALLRAVARRRSEVDQSGPPVSSNRLALPPGSADKP